MKRITQRLFFITSLIILFSTGSLVSPAVTAAPKGPSADVIVDNIQKYYQNVSDFSADFVQTTAHKMFAGHYQRSYGRVMFQNGGLMRWEYTRPEKKLFVYDGKTLWIYEPDVPQIFKGTANADKLRKALAFLTGQGKIKDSYKAARAEGAGYGFKDGYVLILVPKEKNSPFKNVELYVNSTTYQVVRSVVIDHEGNRNRLDFTNSRTNTNLPAKLFQFTPAAGVPVLTAD